MKHIRGQEFYNDAGETFDGPTECADVLGTDEDEAFVRGRDYASKGRPPSSIKTATKHKPKAIYVAMLNGYNWQKWRMK